MANPNSVRNASRTHTEVIKTVVEIVKWALVPITLPALCFLLMLSVLILAGACVIVELFNVIGGCLYGMGNVMWPLPIRRMIFKSRRGN